MATAEATQTIERRTIAKVSWRLLPLVAVAYCIAYIDRSNISVAALTMNKDLGFSAYLYGWGAGIFFFGYFLFEVPSNLILEKIGARIWIARIMITWGIISGLTALVTGPTSFLIIRFLLGAAEAGFFPGMILYLTYWFPAQYRGRVISTLFIAQPVANAIASSGSAAILGMDGVLGLRGWQWIFIIEAIPAVVLGLFILRIMTDRPARAAWLADDERNWLQTRLDNETRAIERDGHMTWTKALSDPRVLALSVIYLGSVTANYGIVFFMPQIVKGLGLSDMMTGFVSSGPYIVGTIGLLAWGWSSDRNKERRWHLITASTLGAAGLAFAAWSGASYWALLGMSMATAGIYGSRAAFWPMPSLFLTGTAAAGAIAMINAIGNLGGYIGPFVVGWIKDSTQSFQAGLYFLAACSLMAAVVTFFAARAAGAPAAVPSPSAAE
ncbi:MFS transporter [Bradyrhizobium erythrophlei]|jgi:ACS family tartrate transporter-like MFS transporter|uniref:MFS transporter, ACS family, tartrate transporter n=1 Tax=Bradyrhizobium erythrophlei TaxID=1437360 RepID=A0A1M7SVX8_9BRAD|nr:MFS transporter [Bradyrhizobium erythrophlei]SHN62673.1 MFS transporter, ACS family, tartrate transporter [Bradyrhizobium erythrophlei]